MTSLVEAAAILSGLNEAQREAATTVSGPVAIVAGAGSGKTRVVSHRAAYAVASGAVDERRMLLVTFTEKAAAEMLERVRSMGLGRVSARTFHSAALAQLRHFWPSRHDGARLPDVMADKWRIVAPLARSLPGGYRFAASKDLIDEIEWAKGQRLTPTTYGERADRTPPIPMDLFGRLFGDYERAKARRGLIDFDDILALTVELLETDPEAADEVRERFGWFTVDEFQDTTPLQARLLELWLGDRRDICVVGDEDQTIYTFAGATPDHLRDFGSRYPDARIISLLENYRSSPQVIGLANRLLASAGRDKQLKATRGPGPEPAILAFADHEAELRAVAARVRDMLADGVPAEEMAVLVRLNAQLVSWETAFSRADIPYQVRGQRFFARREVQAAIGALRRLDPDLTGGALADAIREAWQEQLGFEPDEVPQGREARERHAALTTLFAIVSEAIEACDPSSGGARDAVVGELERRADREADADVRGVELLTLHRAKGLEWEAVFIPSLEEGLLPVGQAGGSDAALAEERRLLYVGITRARRHLTLSWARQRPSANGAMQGRTPSRFLRALGGVAARASAAGTSSSRRRSPGDGSAPRSSAREGLDRDDARVFDALRAWRLERARADRVSPFIVAYDSVLASIAQRRPHDEVQLLAIPGIGPGKVERYGAEILRVLADF